MKGEQKAYLVNTSKCQIIRWPPFDDQILAIYENRTNHRIVCNSGKHLQISIERYNLSGIEVINNSNKKIDCFWSQVHRNEGTDDFIYYSPSIEFDFKSIKYFSSNVSVVRITCFVDKGMIFSSITYYMYIEK